MYKQILESIEGIGIYPIISLVMFFFFFVIMIIWLFKMDKNYLKRMEHLPLDQNESKKIFTGDNNEI